MRVRGRIVGGLAAVAVWLVLLPNVASAHAYLVKTVPAASQELNASPPNIQLTYDEAVEPRFAIISVTDAEGRQETTGPVRRSPGNPDTVGRAVAAAPAGGLVSDLLAGDLGRWAPRAGRVHLRGGAEPGSGTPVPGPEHLRDRHDAAGAHHPVARCSSR